MGFLRVVRKGGKQLETVILENFSWSHTFRKRLLNLNVKNLIITDLKSGMLNKMFDLF